MNYQYNDVINIRMAEVEVRKDKLKRSAAHLRNESKYDVWLEFNPFFRSVFQFFLSCSESNQIFGNDSRKEKPTGGVRRGGEGGGGEKYRNIKDELVF